MIALDLVPVEDLLRFEIEVLHEELDDERSSTRAYGRLWQEENTNKEIAEDQVKKIGQELATLKCKMLKTQVNNRFLQRQGLKIDRPAGEAFGFKFFTDISLPDDIILIKRW